MRGCGVLMHITSLPGPYGVGTMGRQAFAFADFLKAAGQSCWQVLPLNPTGYGDSPYQSCSAYAGSHYLIDLDLLVEEGLLKGEEIEAFPWYRREDKVDFGLLHSSRLKVLRLAFARFVPGAEYREFVTESRDWLPDFALYMALKDRFGGDPWYLWPDPLKFRKPDALENARKGMERQIGFYCFVQFLFHRQWTALRRYVNGLGIRIIGDVPIYVPRDSVEVWTEPELFQLEKDLTPTAVAGCPPDAFTEDGQLWGNPLYRWEVMEADGFSWWIRRLKAAGQRFDCVRLDHFRGFEGYWSVPFGDKTARNGQWVKGPGEAFVLALKKHLPRLSMIAEDLGYVTREVARLRDLSGYPGMKVLSFAFDSREPSDYLPHTYTANTVCYTGTHDNVTMRQWFDTASPEAADYAKEYMAISQGESPVWGMIRTAYACVSDLCVIPMQDLLELGAEARMNFPGTLSDSNWTWRLKNGIIPKNLAPRLKKLARLYARCPQNNK